MANISFRIKPHSVYKDRQVVEILVGGQVNGVIYPDEKAHGIKIVSAHMKEEIEPGFHGVVIADDGKTSFPPIPSLRVEFRSSSYFITKDGLVKHS